jgi:hypothetical protein
LLFRVYGIECEHTPGRRGLRGDRCRTQGSRVQGYQVMGSRWEGGVNHCRPHCRSAKFCGLMYRGRYSAVIGRKTRFLYVPAMTFQALGYFQPITALYFPPYTRPRNLANRQCERQWLTPHSTVTGNWFRDLGFTIQSKGEG